MRSKYFPSKTIPASGKARQANSSQNPAFKDIEKAGGQTLRQNVKIKQGIDSDNAKKVVKFIKEKKLKVQASIRGEEVRVEGKKRDDLQDVMTAMKSFDLDLPVQFINFRD